MQNVTARLIKDVVYLDITGKEKVIKAGSIVEVTTLATVRFESDASGYVNIEHEKAYIGKHQGVSFDVDKSEFTPLILNRLLKIVGNA